MGISVVFFRELEILRLQDLSTVDENLRKTKMSYFW